MPTTDFPIVRYSPEMAITNMGILPAGTGAKYLEVMEAHNGTYIAVQWRRTLPKTIGKGRLLIEFP